MKLSTQAVMSIAAMATRMLQKPSKPALSRAMRPVKTIASIVISALTHRSPPSPRKRPGMLIMIP